MRISGFPARFKAYFGPFRHFPACFGHIGRRPIRTDMAWFWPNQPDSERIEPRRRESSRVGPNLKKKKNWDAAPTRGQPRRTRVRHPPSHVRDFYFNTTASVALIFYFMPIVSQSFIDSLIFVFIFLQLQDALPCTLIPVPIIHALAWPEISKL